jgi:hypothetical protein
MRPIAFSTGALAYPDFRKALQMLRGIGVEVLELSALREAELAPLMAAIDTLGLSQFRYVSIHAPSFYRQENEPEIVNSLRAPAGRGWPIVVHPDAIYGTQYTITRCGAHSARIYALRTWTTASPSDVRQKR